MLVSSSPSVPRPVSFVVRQTRVEPLKMHRGGNSDMRKLRRMILFLVAGVIAVGCEPEGRSLIPLTNPPFLTPVATPTQRYELQGFSFLPPAGENWFIVSPSHPSRLAEVLPTAAQDLFFIKKLRESPPTRPEDHQTIFASVATTTRFGELSFEPAEYLRNKAREIEARYTEDTKTEQFRPVTIKASTDNSLGTGCVRYNKVVEDHRVRLFPGTVFIMEDHGFLCPHPNFPRFIVNLSYSQRYLRGEQPLPVEKEIAPFFKSLMFTPVRPLEARGGEGTLSPEAARKELDRLYIPYTPGALIAHAQADNNGAVALLLTAGANPNAAGMGVSPLAVAAIAGHTDITQVLLAKGADVNAKDPRFGLTALMAAALAGHTDPVKALLAAGADAHAKAADGKTALMFAKERGHTVIIELLKQAGAKE